MLSSYCCTLIYKVHAWCMYVCTCTSTCHHPSLDLFYFLLLPLTCCTPCACTFLVCPICQSKLLPCCVHPTSLTVPTHVGHTGIFQLPTTNHRYSPTTYFVPASSSGTIREVSNGVVISTKAFIFNFLSKIRSNHTSENEIFSSG